MTTDIKRLVFERISGANVAWLEDVYYHGIHNVTNDYADSDDYDAISSEFKRQTGEALDAIERIESKGY